MVLVIMTVIIAGERSGVGKTTITLSILSFLAKNNLKTQSFKVGPDYIDPMFHSKITRRSCRNLDPILTSENYVKCCYNYHLNQVDYAIIEGVMGLFDGVFLPDFINTNKDQSINDYGSTAHVARLLNLPVILVVDCSKLSNSVAAIIHGFNTFDPQVKIIGVILNKVGSDRHLKLLENALKSLNIKIIGVFKRQDNITIGDRHLGLIPTEEISNFQNIVDQLAILAQNCLNWDILLPLLKTNSVANLSCQFQSENTQERCLYYLKDQQEKSLYFPSLKPIKIAVAKDKAFNFYYQDNLDLLQAMGAELIEFSPLVDQTLPNDLKGLYLGGGFPEIFAQQLTENITLKQQLKTLINQGLPTYAECGGLMYLGENLIDFDGKNYEMLGVLPFTSQMGKKLTLGYRQGTCLEDSIFMAKNQQIWGHEFHRSTIITNNEKPLLKLQNLYDHDLINEGWYDQNIHASYLHTHWGENLNFVQRWLNFCSGRENRNLKNEPNLR